MLVGSTQPLAARTAVCPTTLLHGFSDGGQEHPYKLAVRSQRAIDGGRFGVRRAPKRVIMAPGLVGSDSPYVIEDQDDKQDDDRVKGDLQSFKELIEESGRESGAWRGEIEN